MLHHPRAKRTLFKLHALACGFCTHVFTCGARYLEVGPARGGHGGLGTQPYPFDRKLRNIFCCCCCSWTTTGLFTKMIKGGKDLGALFRSLWGWGKSVRLEKLHLGGGGGRKRQRKAAEAQKENLLSLKVFYCFWITWKYFVNIFRIGMRDIKSKNRFFSKSKIWLWSQSDKGIDYKKIGRW